MAQVAAKGRVVVLGSEQAIEAANAERRAADGVAGDVRGYRGGQERDRPGAARIFLGASPVIGGSSREWASQHERP